MRKVLITLAAIMTMATPAMAATDLGDGVCQQTDGTQGFWNGTTADDAGCITEAEYEQMYSASNLKDVGVIEDYEVNPDGTTTLIFDSERGIENTVESNPLDRPVAANPELEPDAPTVRDVFERARAEGFAIV